MSPEPPAAALSKIYAEKARPDQMAGDAIMDAGKVDEQRRSQQLAPP